METLEKSWNLLWTRKEDSRNSLNESKSEAFLKAKKFLTEKASKIADKKKTSETLSECRDELKNRRLAESIEKKLTNAIQESKISSPRVDRAVKMIREAAKANSDINKAEKSACKDTKPTTKFSTRVDRKTKISSETAKEKPGIDRAEKSAREVTKVRPGIDRAKQLATEAVKPTPRLSPRVERAVKLIREAAKPKTQLSPRVDRAVKLIREAAKSKMPLVKGSFKKECGTSMPHKAKRSFEKECLQKDILSKKGKNIREEDMDESRTHQSIKRKITEAAIKSRLEEKKNLLTPSMAKKLHRESKSQRRIGMVSTRGTLLGKSKMPR